MGTKTHILHSLRARFSRSKDAAPQRLSSYASTNMSDAQDGSGTCSEVSVVDTLGTTPGSSPFKTEHGRELLSTIGDLKEQVYAEEEQASKSVSAKVELAAGLAVMQVVRRVPWGELEMIGCGIGNSDAEMESGFVSGGQLAKCMSMALQDGNVVQESGTLSKSWSPDTLSLASADSDSTWSFACRSARRVEMVQCEDGADADGMSSFGGFSGWGGVLEDDQDTQTLGSSLETGAQYGLKSACFTMDSAEFDALPDWSDVEDEPEYNVRFGRAGHRLSLVEMSALAETSSTDTLCLEDMLVLPRVQIGQDVYMDKKRKSEEESETPKKRLKTASNKKAKVIQPRQTKGMKLRSAMLARI